MSQSFTEMDTQVSDAGRVDVCTECGSRGIIKDEESGEYICGRCGLVVVEEILDRGPEWRAFNKEQIESRTRTGAPVTPLIHDRGMSTTIDRRDLDYQGRRIKPEQSEKMRRLRTWQAKSKITGARERNLAFALSTIGKYCYTLNLPKSTLERAAVIYRNVLKKNLIRGRSIEEIAVACVYAATKETPDVQRTLKEIEKKLKIKKKKIGRVYRLLLKNEVLKARRDKISNTVPRIVNKLNLERYIEYIGVGIGRYIEDPENKGKHISGKDAMGLSAAVVYIASLLTRDMPANKKVSVPQKYIANVANTTEVTIRNRLRQLENSVFNVGNSTLKEMSEILGTIVSRYLDPLNTGSKTPLEELKKKYTTKPLEPYLNLLEDISTIRKIIENGEEFYEPAFPI